MRSVLFPFFFLIVFGAAAQNINVNVNLNPNTDNLNEQQFALNNNNPVNTQQVQVNTNDNPQVQQAAIQFNPQQVQYNPNKPGQSIHVSSYGGGGYSGSGSKVKKTRTAPSASYQIKKAFARLSDGHKITAHYGKKGRVKKCARF